MGLMPAQTHTLAHAHTHTHTLPQMGHLLGDPLRDLGWFRLLCETGHIAESRVTDVSAGQFSGGPSPDSSPTHPARRWERRSPQVPDQFQHDRRQALSSSSPHTLQGIRPEQLPLPDNGVPSSLPQNSPGLLEAATLP